MRSLHLLSRQNRALLRKKNNTRLFSGGSEIAFSPAADIKAQAVQIPDILPDLSLFLIFSPASPERGKRKGLSLLHFFLARRHKCRP